MITTNSQFCQMARWIQYEEMTTHLGYLSKHPSSPGSQSILKHKTGLPHYRWWQCGNLSLSYSSVKMAWNLVSSANKAIAKACFAQVLKIFLESDRIIFEKQSRYFSLVLSVLSSYEELPGLFLSPDAFCLLINNIFFSSQPKEGLLFFSGLSQYKSGGKLKAVPPPL